MKEAVFVKRNEKKWKLIETNLGKMDKLAVDELADLYTEVTSDLSFAQSHYPESRITEYLNNLAAKVHTGVYGKRKETARGFLSFWTETMPRTVWESRKALLVSLSVFVLSVLIGVLSELNDPTFSSQVLGPGYVEMTLENIAKGKPTDVYDSGKELDMFLGITINNIRVAFNCFMCGIFTFFGTGYFLLKNGVMLGSFQTFFFTHGVGIESMLAIWIHGTLEISSLVIAGGASIELGRGWLLPGTYSRKKSFVNSALRGVRLMISVTPLFVIAGFLEGFVTRHAEWPNVVRLFIILASLAFIIYYYVVLPVKVSGRKIDANMFKNLFSKIWRR